MLFLVPTGISVCVFFSRQSDIQTYFGARAEGTALLSMGNQMVTSEFRE